MFLPGGSTDNISFTVINDAIVEVDETIIITLSNPLNAVLGTNTTHTYTIKDDDNSVQFTTTSSSASEAASSSNIAVSLANTSAATITVDYAVTGGTATGSGTDYTLASGTLTFNPGNTTKNITISVNNDTIDEFDETVIITLSNPSNATLGTNTSHTFTINDNDTMPSVAFSLSSSNASEATTSATIAVALSSASGKSITVDYAVSGGTATGSGTDYTLASGTLTFNPGTSSQNISFSVIDDLIDENNETVIVTLSNPTNSNLGGITNHTYTINDNDIAPSISFDLSTSNASEATTPALLAVSLSNPSAFSITVDYAVTGGTATGSGTDFTLSSGTLTFSPGVTTQNISAAIVDDLITESNETIVVTISNPSNATIGTNAAHTYTINDNEATPTVAFDLSTSTANEATTPALLAVSLSNTTASTVTVDYTVTGGTATGSGTDFTLSSGTLTFNPGDSTKNISVTIVEDLLDENDENLVVTLSNPSNATLGAQTNHSYTIIDNDPTVSVAFDLTSSNADEATTPALLAVSLSSISGRTCSRPTSHSVINSDSFSTSS